MSDVSDMSNVTGTVIDMVTDAHLESSRLKSSPERRRELPMAWRSDNKVGQGLKVTNTQGGRGRLMVDQGASKVNQQTQQSQRSRGSP